MKTILNIILVAFICAWVVAMCLAVAGCNTPKVDGGSSRQVIPIESGNIDMNIIAPQNPETPSSSNYEKVVEEIMPSGTRVITTTRVSNELGASQDIASIMKVVKSESEVILRTLLGAAFIILGGYLAYRKLQITGAMVAGAGIITVMYGFTAGLISVVVAVFGYLMYRINKPI